MVGDGAVNLSAGLQLSVDFLAFPFGQLDRIRFFGVGLAAVPLLDVVQRGIAFDMKANQIRGGDEPADRVLAFRIGIPVTFTATSMVSP